MKKLYIIFLLTLAIGVCSAQKRVEVGLKAAVGTSWLGIKAQESTGGAYVYSDGPSSACWSAGIISEIRLTKVLFIQPEMLYTQVSGRYEQYSKTNFSGKEQLTYSFYDRIYIGQLQFPLNVKLKLGRLYVMSGPCYSVLFANNNLIKRTGSSTGYYNKFNRDDIGVNTSIGLEVVKKPSINIDIRHYRGLRDLDNIGYHQTFMQIGASILF